MKKLASGLGREAWASAQPVVTAVTAPTVAPTRSFLRISHSPSLLTG
jgi:hypothetical protein